jgi:hypothetical protein
MRGLRPGSGSSSWLPCALLAAAAALPLHAASIVAQGGGQTPRVSLAEYREHLENLSSLVTTCQKQRTATACDRARVGSDDKVQWTSAGATTERDVRFDWLRDLLDQAGKKSEAGAGKSEPDQKPKPETNTDTKTGANPATKTSPESLDALLTQAQQRLAEDWNQASTAVQAGPGYDRERRNLNAILARKEYQGVSKSSSRERFLEWLANRLDGALASLARFGSRSPWIAFALRALLLGAICLALVWMLIRIERRSRIKLVPEPLTIAGAPSAREWQLWMADAHAMAEQGLWREAIHFLYWAAIARLESRRMWPADRARTPREYLRLLPAADPRQSNLAALTRTFERTWYGGREAGSFDFKAAEKLAAELGVE